LRDNFLLIFIIRYRRKHVQVGIYIEDLDIEDIADALEDVEAQDLERVLNNLLLGSENHLNAFTTSQTVAPGCQ
jgi:hypothetical protein